MFRKSLNYFKIAVRTAARSADILFTPGINAVRQTTKAAGENLLELNSLPGAKFNAADLAVFGREVNQGLTIVAKGASKKTTAYSQLLANCIVNTAKEFGKKAGILNEDQNVKQCIVEYLIQNLAEYAVSLHVKNENKNCVADFSDIKHIPLQANTPMCVITVMLTPLINRLFMLGVENAHELAHNAYQVLVECKEKLAEQLYVADLDNYAYQLSKDEILAHCQSSYGTKVNADIEVKRGQLIQQYRNRRMEEHNQDLSKIEFSANSPALENVQKYSPF